METGSGRRRITVDGVIALAFVVADAVETLVRHWADPARLAIEMPGALLFGFLVLRRTRPVLTITVFTTVAIGNSLLEAGILPHPKGPADAFVPIIALLLMTYSLGAYGSWWQVLLGGVQPIALIVVIDSAQPSSYSLPSALAFFGVFVVVVPVLAGRLIRGRSAMVARLRDRQRQLDEQREAAVGAALAAERLRIADRLHADLVAGMESLVERVRIAQRNGPGQADAVAGIESSARALLSETRGVVVALSRQDDLRDTEGVDVRDGARDVPDEPLGPVPDARVGSAVAGRVAVAGQPEGGAATAWTAIAAAAVCVGFLLEVRGMAVGVPMPVALLGCVAIGAPLAFAASRPLLATTLVWGAAAAFSVYVVPLADVFASVSLGFLTPFIVAAGAPWRRALVGLGICVLGMLACLGPGGLADNGVVLPVSWAAGRVLYERVRLATELRATNAQLEEQRALASRRAVLEERARVARELHDAVGHSLTVIALQAGAARRRWDADQVTARAALATIVRVAGDGLDELRLGFVTAGIEDPGRLGTPDALAGLVDGARTAGLRVDLRVDGADGVALDAGARLAAYRVVQEALTNVLKHAPAATADVTLRRDGDHLSIVVTNTPTGLAGADDPGGRARAATAAGAASAGSPTAGAASAGTPTVGGGGQGLAGMRQRTLACGGELDWQRRPDGGFEVRARFPVRQPA